MKHENFDKFVNYVGANYGTADAVRTVKLRRDQLLFDYYHSALPLNSDGEPDYVEPICANKVNAVYPLASKNFVANSAEVVSFRPRDKEITKATADAVNKYINQIYVAENNGMNFAGKSIRNMLITGDAIAKVYEEENAVYKDIKIKEKTPINEVVFEIDEYNTISLEEAINEYPHTDWTTLNFEVVEEEVETVVDPKVQKGMSVLSGMGQPSSFKNKVSTTYVSGKVCLTRIDPQIKVAFIPTADMYIDPTLLDTDIRLARFIGHRVITTRGELVALGFDLETVMESDLADPTLNGEIYMNPGEEQANGDKMEQQVFLYDTYIWSSLFSKDNTSRLYQVLSGQVGGCVYHIQEIDRIPFVHGVCEQNVDRFWGTGLVSPAIQHQELASYLSRQIRLNGDRANLGMLVVNEGKVDLRDLMNQRALGIVKAKEQGQIQALPFSPLPQGYTALYQTVKQNANEETNRAITPAMGDNLANTTATAMAIAVDQSEQNNNVILTTIGNTFFKPLHEEIYALLIKKDLELKVYSEIPEKFKAMLTQSGQEVPEFEIVRSSTLPERVDFFIDVFTQNDKARQSTVLLQMAPQLMEQGLMDQNGFRKVAEFVFEAAGILDCSEFLVDPSKVNVPTPEEQAAQREQKELEDAVEHFAFQKEMVEVIKSLNDIAKDTVLGEKEIISKEADAYYKAAHGVSLLSDSETNAEKVNNAFTIDKADHNLQVMNSEVQAVLTPMDKTPNVNTYFSNKV